MSVATSTSRQKLNFDTGWFFHKGDIPVQHAVKAGLAGGLTDSETAEVGDWLAVAYSDKRIEGQQHTDEWVAVRLPHDWLVAEYYSRDADWERGYLKSGIGFYRKTFEIPESDIGQKISIQFDGIVRNSTVWVNGHLLGNHPSGFTSFHYDLTDVLRYGDEGKNVILVKADATNYEGWWYDGAGIYRHVWLLKTNPLHVGQWGTYVTTPDMTAEQAHVRVQTTVLNEFAVSVDCALQTDIVDRDGRVVASVTSTASIDNDEAHVFDDDLLVSPHTLWSLDNPYLYKAVSTVLQGGVVRDQYETTFGIRTIEFTSDNGFFLNGQHVPIKGICCHQNFAGVGAAMPDRIIEYRLELIKAMGANAYRSAHHPPTPELLDMCDRMGILVMDENRRLDSSPEGLRDLTSMILRDRNHPSIILWSMENEEDLQGTKMGARILETLVRTTRKLDPTRPTTAAMNKRRNDNGYSDLLDVVGYNYGKSENSDVRDHEAHPNRVIIGSESAAFTTTRGIYADDPDKGYCSSYGTQMPFCAPDTSGWCTTPERAWGDVVKYPFLTGVFIWTAFDYRGEPSPYRWPNVNSHFGIMDMCGLPKDNYFYYKAAWTNEPTVHIFPHWNWPGREGQDVDVWAYSNCERVALYLNGKLVEEKEMVPNGHLEWQVPYAPGELRAVGKQGGVEVAAHVVTSTGAVHHIELEADRTQLHANGRDVSVVRVSLRDAARRIVPIADDEIRFVVEGPGSIIGVGNGDPSSHEPDKSSRRRAFNGYCMVLIETSTEPGRIKLLASAPGRLSADVSLQST